MKTTVEIPDALLARAKVAAAKDKTTVRELILQGLREALEKRRKPSHFVFRPVVLREGGGYTPEFEGASWDKIRAAIYEGHGGE